MLSLTSEYALRAMVFLVKQERGLPLSGGRISSGTGVPRKYLSTILADLVRAGVLTASPGRSGGFRLAREPEKILLREVVEAFEPLLWKRRPCPFGNEICDDIAPCGGHEHWKKVRDAFSEFLDGTTLLDVSNGKALGAPSHQHNNGDSHAVS